MFALFLLILCGFLQGDQLELHSISSKAARVLLVEVEVLSQARGESAEDSVRVKVTKVALGNEKLKGQVLSVEYYTSFAGTRRPICYFSSDGKIPVGEIMVIEIRPAKVGYEVKKDVNYIARAWRKNHPPLLPQFDVGQEAIKYFGTVNKAASAEELDQFLLEILKQKSNHLDDTIRFFFPYAYDRKTLLEKIPPSAEYTDRLREVLGNVTKPPDTEYWLRHADEQIAKKLKQVEVTTEPNSLTSLVSSLIGNYCGGPATVSAKWKEPLGKFLRDTEQRPQKERIAIYEGVKSRVVTERWPILSTNSKLLLWDTLFQAAETAKDAELRQLWKDLLVEQTQLGAMFIKEDVLARLDKIQDKAFRDQLREAAYTPSPKFGVAPDRREK